MEESNSFKLNLNEHIFLIPTNFLSINDVDSGILFILKTKKQYNIKSNVNSEVLQLFINHWVNKVTPEITLENIQQFDQLSREFDRMKDLIQIYKNISSKNSISPLLLQKNYKSLELLKRNIDQYKKRNQKHQEIIKRLFSNPIIYDDIKLKKDLLFACRKKDLKLIDILTKNKTVINGLTFILNEEDKTTDIYINSNADENIFIPKSIDINYEEYVVKTIIKNYFQKSTNFNSIQFSEDSEIELFDDNSFSNSKIENISIPKSLSKIGERSFSNCTKLKSVTFSEDSEFCTIGSYAFTNCAIEDILICTKSVVICSYAFQECKQLKKVEITSKFCEISQYAFAYSSIKTLSISSEKIELKDNWCGKVLDLDKIIISPENNEYCSYHDDQILLKKSDLNNVNYDIIVYASNKIEELTIPSFIKRIDSNSFFESYIQKVEFSEDSILESIGKSAFCNSKLQSIVIPSTVSSIEENAFFSCRSLNKIEFSNNSKLKTIEKSAFCNCTFKSFTIPSSVTCIDEYAFSYCDCLENINFNNDSKLKVIGGFAFVETSIENLIIPSKVTEIDNFWCSYMIFLKNINVMPNNNNFLNLNNSLFIGKSLYNQFEKNDIFDVLLFAKRDIKNIVKIPSFIKRIAPFAFNFCTHIKTIEFSSCSELQSIENSAFTSCLIEYIKIPSKVKFIGEKAFTNCVKLNYIDFSNNSELVLINELAFSYASLRCFCIPSHVKMIGTSAFYDCKYLQIIEFNDDCEIETIRKSFFNGCENCIIMISVKYNN